MKEPTISVIMAVYNTPKAWLKEAIDSVLNQTFADFELLIVNDGSTNPEVDEAVKSYPDERIRYFVIPNGGASVARNYGLDKATGKYIAILDSDDIALPIRFEKQVSFLEAHPDVSVCGSNMELFHAEDGTVFDQTHCATEPHILDLMKNTPMPHSSAMWRREDFERFKIRYNPAFKIVQDYDLFKQAIQHFKLFVLQEILLRYRVCQSSLFHSNRPIVKEEIQEIHESLLNYLTTDKILQKKLATLCAPLPKKDFCFQAGWETLFAYLFLQKRTE